MKYAIVMLSLVFLILACASTQPATSEEMKHEFIVEYPTYSKQVLFDKTLKWIANNFRSAKQVIEYQNIESGAIVGNGIVDVQVEGTVMGTDIEFTMNIDIKDEKVRYRFSNFSMMIYSDRYPMPNTQPWHIAIHRKFEAMTESMKSYTIESDNF